MSIYKFEVNMNTTEVKNAIAPPSWCYYLYVHSHNEIKSKLPSRMVTAFLLDSGASILGFDKPT